MTNSEIINVPTISESPNLSEIGSIAPAGADDAKVVFNTRVPANIVKYHFFPFEKFLARKISPTNISRSQLSIERNGGQYTPGGD